MRLLLKLSTFVLYGTLLRTVAAPDFFLVLASISVAENGKLTRYRANVTTDYLSLLSAINNTITGDGLATTLIHAR